MTVRLSHRQKPDTSHYIFQALGSPFSLTGIAASLRIAYRMSIPDKIPYVLSGQSATVSKLPPVWGTMSAYSITEGVTVSAQTLPVTVPNGGSPTITVAWHSSSVPSTKPAWVTLTSGAVPTIAFTGGQLDANDVSSMVLSATANGQLALSQASSIDVVSSTSLSISYSAAEGTAIGPPGGGLMWQSAFTTIDGTIIDSGTGDHGHQADNSVREYDPAAAVGSRQSNVFAPQTYGGYALTYPPTLNPGGPSLPAGAIPWTQYDNHMQYYIPRLDCLVWPSRGQFQRGANSWTLACRTELRDNGSGGVIEVSTGTAQYVSGLPGDTRQLGWAGGVQVVGKSATSLFRPYGSGMDETDPFFVDMFGSDYNPHSAWSAQFDCGFRIGGANYPTDRPYMWITTRSNYFDGGIYPQPYVTYRLNCPSLVSGVPPFRQWGRDGCVFANDYVYWVGGITLPAYAGGDPDNYTPHFFRMNIVPYLTTRPSAIPTSGPGSIERLTDAPWSLNFGLLRHDPYSNMLVLIHANGIALFDLRTMSWSIVTPSDYSTFFNGYMPKGCTGDYVDYRTSNQFYYRRIYWRAGQPNVPSNQVQTVWSPGNGQATKERAYHSLKITRPADPVSYLNLSAAHPENPANDLGTYGGPFRAMKHQGLFVVGSGSSRKMYLATGDWSDNYPTNTDTTPGYKPEGQYTDSGRQEIWELPIGDTEIASSSIRAAMVSNAYAKYPWTGSSGYYSSATKGPAGPDGMGQCVDKRGQIWIGPTANTDYVIGHPELQGQRNNWSPMWKWTKPGTNNTAVTGAGVNGVALGNGWTLPNQDRLYSPIYGGTQGVDYDVAVSGASDGFSWGRLNPHGTVYDSVNDRIYTISIGTNGGAKTFAVQLYAFNPIPDGGNVHRWTKSTLQTRNCRDYGGPADNQYTGINMSGWGANITSAAEMIGRKIYFVALWGYTGPTNGLAINNPPTSSHCRAHLMSINVDTLEIEWIPFPQNQNWWLRTWDGQDALIGGAAGLPLSPGEYRNLACVGTKVVLGPDAFIKIGVDPWVCAYDTTNKTWTTFAPPTGHDWPMSKGSLVGVPDLGEAWLLGNFPGGVGDATFAAAHGLHIPPANAGRRIVRFKVN